MKTGIRGAESRIGGQSEWNNIEICTCFTIDLKKGFKQNLIISLKNVAWRNQSMLPWLVTYAFDVRYAMITDKLKLHHPGVCWEPGNAVFWMTHQNKQHINMSKAYIIKILTTYFLWSMFIVILEILHVIL